MAISWNTVAQAARTVAGLLSPPATRTTSPAPQPSAPQTPAARPTTRPATTQPATTRPTATQLTTDYPGDYRGKLRPEYTPHLDGQADPGEVVWTWVPYEEDFTQGKDRPVLVVGEDEPWLLAVMLTSKDHNRDQANEERWGRFWMDIGTGPWDSKGRPSEIRLDRVIRVNPNTVRREGAIMDKALFTRVAHGITQHHK